MLALKQYALLVAMETEIYVDRLPWKQYYADRLPC